MVHSIRRQQFVPVPLARVWDYFSNAGNLAAITPDYMRFRVTSGDLPDVVYPGQVITYTVRPLLGIPLFWMTEITAVSPGHSFVDEQRRGPYKMWHHQHLFFEQDGGTLMQDIVHYELPFWILGEAAHALFVRRQLEGIFEFRRKKVEELFRV